MKRLMLTMLLLVCVFSVNAAGAGGMFSHGSTRLSLLAGNGTAFDKSYFVIGAGAGYYVLDGLGVGMTYEHWSGAGPSISKYSPFAEYVFNQTSSVLPYVGGFYRHTAVDGLSGIDSLGARAGVYIAVGSNVYAGVGLVHESYLACQTSVISNCSETYTDLSLTFGF